MKKKKAMKKPFRLSTKPLLNPNQVNVNKELMALSKSALIVQILELRRKVWAQIDFEAYHKAASIREINYQDNLKKLICELINSHASMNIEFNILPYNMEDGEIIKLVGLKF
jgi:inorganic pyrophosphatase/exopolyphosphatase